MLLMSPLVRDFVSFLDCYVLLSRVPGGSDRSGECRLRQSLRTPSGNELSARGALPKVLGSELVPHRQR